MAIDFFFVFKFRNLITMTWTTVLSQPGIWPMVHVLLPGTIAIYAQNIWIVLSLIYLFESFEYLLSEISGSWGYWGEISKADSIIFDIIMGVLGYACVKILDFRPPKVVHKYAFLSPKRIHTYWYTAFAPYLHIILLAISTGFGFIADTYTSLPSDSIVEYIVFGILYILITEAFGFTNWNAFSTANIVIVSVISVFTRFTTLVSLGTFFLTTFAVYNYKNWKQETKKPSGNKIPPQPKTKSPKIPSNIVF